MSKASGYNDGSVLSCFGVFYLAALASVTLMQEVLFRNGSSEKKGMSAIDEEREIDDKLHRNLK